MSTPDVDAAVERELGIRRAKRRGGEIDFLCVAHEESTPSASWNRKKGVWSCLSGACGATGTTADLAGRLGIHVESTKEQAERSKIVAVYPYRGEDGALLFEVVRMVPKSFRRRAPDGTWSTKDIKPVLYRLPELLASTGRVYVVEGEKDVDALRARGLTATCNPGGATETGRSKWYSELFNRHLAGREVVILPDRDKAGDNHALYVGRSLVGTAAAIKVIHLPGLEWKPKKGPDVADWLLMGGDEEELEALADAAPLWQPPAEAAPSDVASFTLTDVGNGQWFAHLFSDRVRYDYIRKRWLIWTGQRWLPDPDGAIYRFGKAAAVERRKAGAALDRAFGEEIVEWGYRMEGMARMESMLKMAQSEPSIKDAGAGWDAQPALLGCENGVVNLLTGEFRPARQDDRITMTCGIAYDAKAAAPRWGQFLQEVFRGDAEVIGFIQRAIGYSLTGSVKEQAWFLGYGNGSNGKSTFVDTIARLMGEYGGDTPAETICGRGGFQGGGGPSPDIAALQGKRFITCSETEELAKMNASRVKWLTGGNPITGRFLNENLVTFNPQMKIWLTTNHLPRVDDDSDGYWRRVRLVPFNAKFEGAARELDLEERLGKELPGILNWAIEGAREWARHGLQAPASVMLATHNYRQASDPLGEFITDRCVLGETRRATRGQLYEAYRGWAKAQGFSDKDMLGAPSFGRRVAERWPNRPMHGNRWYVGIGLRIDGEEPPSVTQEGSPDSRVTLGDPISAFPEEIPYAYGEKPAGDVVASPDDFEPPVAKPKEEPYADWESI